MATLTIYHNPGCSKSRKTLELIQARGLKPRIVEYLDDPPTPEQLKQILKALGIGPRQLIRRGEDQFRQLGLDRTDISDAELIVAMHEHPVLMQRPVVVCGNRACIGRPPESVLDILP